MNADMKQIMLDYADLTGLSTERKTQRRYLWTDAFAVCNYLELYRQTGEAAFRELALRLVDNVHTTLGHHREDDPRAGWVSGLEENEGKMHPTVGGLRIGKELRERKPGERFDETLEWNRDGQYYHYLVKWMHALNRVSEVTSEPVYNLWAIELAKKAHAAFTYAPPSGGPKRMYWKMSIDLSYPLVSSMGQHDPLDGLVTYRELQMTQSARPKALGEPGLVAEISDMAAMCKGKNWSTDDPLGIGGLLSDAYRLAQLVSKDNPDEEELLMALLDDSEVSLRSYIRGNSLRLPAQYRLAFRELGLTIGLKAVQRIKGMTEKTLDDFRIPRKILRQIEVLMKYTPLAHTIESFWLDPDKRKVDSWIEHSGINMVMLATSLAPDGYLTI